MGQGGAEMNAQKILDFVKEYLEETKAWQEDCLKADYGGHWIHMIRTQSGAGYEICEELLDKIEEMEQEEE